MDVGTTRTVIRQTGVSDLVKGPATLNLLKSWVERRSDEHEGRTTSAQKAGEVPVGPETKDTQKRGTSYHAVQPKCAGGLAR